MMASNTSPWRRCRLLIFLNILFTVQHAFGWQIVSLQAVPSYLSSGCAAALSQDVPATVCSPMASRLIKGYFYSEGTLSRTCTDACATFLAEYEASVVSSCGDEKWENYFNAAETDSEPVAVPVRVIPNLTRYLFSLTCLKDAGRFCNVVIGTAAMAADPGNSKFGWGDDVSNLAEADLPSSCDMCFIKRLQMDAGSPYYEGPRLSSMGLYQSLTSSCGITNMPLTTSTLPFATPSGPSEPQPTCAGSTYTVKAGDTCLSVSQSQSIGTGWLVDDNNLGAWCSDFPAPGTNLCIANKCDIYTLQDDDASCAAIARKTNITEPQLKAWNPIINLGCLNLHKMNGTALCVSPPGPQYVAPTVTITGIPGTVTTAVPVPTDKAQGTTDNCGRYHFVESGEYCNLLSLKYGISLADLVFLNTAINENCTNLYALESYCVQAVGDINTYPGRPGHTSTTPTTVVSGPTMAFSLLQDSTLVPYARNDTRSPLAEGTRDDCAVYFQGSLFANLSETGSPRTACAVAASIFFAELDRLGIWNPSLGNSSDPGCTFDAGKRYCGQLYYGADEGTEEPNFPTYEKEIRQGYIEGCTRFEDVPLGWVCSDVFAYYDITLEEFYKYNPAVGADCSGLWTDYAYCTSIDPNQDQDDQETTTSTTTSAASTTTAAPTSAPTGGAPGPTNGDQAARCNKWDVAKSGDSCWAIADRTGISLANLYSWNPFLGADGASCGAMIWPDYWYCVGVSQTGTPATTATTSAATTPTGAPGPTHSGQASNCGKWTMAQSGDSCWAIADRSGISLADLYRWNTALGTDGSLCGSMIWPDYWYCVGLV